MSPQYFFFADGPKAGEIQAVHEFHGGLRVAVSDYAFAPGSIHEIAGGMTRERAEYYSMMIAPRYGEYRRVKHDSNILFWFGPTN